MEIKPRTYNCHHEKLKERTREKKNVKNGAAAAQVIHDVSVSQANKTSQRNGTVFFLRFFLKGSGIVQMELMGGLDRTRRPTHPQPDSDTGLMGLPTEL